MTTSRVTCVDCDTIRDSGVWGFALMARHGWHVSHEMVESAPRWRCARCCENAQRAQAESVSHARSNSPGHAISVLVVDDEEQVGRMTRRILRDFQVVPASGAEEALKILASVRFDVVVSDVSMPGLSGPELYERVYQRWPQLADRFVFVSGNVFNAQTEVAAVARRIGHEMPPLFDKLRCNDTLPMAVLDAANRNATSSGTFPIAADVRPNVRAAG